MAEPKCSIEGCEKPQRYKASGWCGMHYARARKYGTPDAKVREYTAQTGTCRAEGCDRPAQRKGCCQAHYVRLFRGEKDALATPISTQTKKTCTLDGCSRTHVARGYCDLHYSRMQHKGDPGGLDFQEKTPRPDKCQGPECDSPVRAKGYCSAHYRQWREGQELVPKLSFAPAGSGHTNKNGYRVLSVTVDGVRRSVFEHRVAVEEALGRPLLPTETVHHVNGIRHDNSTDGPLILDERGRLRSGNLELWSHAHPRGQEIGPKLDYARGLLALYGSTEERQRFAEFARHVVENEGGEDGSDGQAT